MIEREFIILLLFLFQICKGINIRKESFNQKLMCLQDVTIQIFVLDSRYESLVQSPPDIGTYYQIAAGASGIYNVSEGTSVTVNKYGTITPRNQTEYCYGDNCYNEIQQGKTPDRTETKFFPGRSTITVIDGNNSYKIYIYVTDYRIAYVENIFKDYYETNITNKENDLEKFNL